MSHTQHSGRWSQRPPALDSLALADAFARVGSPLGCVRAAEAMADAGDLLPHEAADLDNADAEIRRLALMRAVLDVQRIRSERMQSTTNTATTARDTGEPQS